MVRSIFVSKAKLLRRSNHAAHPYDRTSAFRFLQSRHSAFGHNPTSAADCFAPNVAVQPIVAATPKQTFRRRAGSTAMGGGPFASAASIAHGTPRSEFAQLALSRFDLAHQSGIPDHIDPMIGATLRGAIIARGHRRGGGLQRCGRGRRDRQDRRLPRRRGSVQQ
jgi:hypothetical protein